MVETAIYVVNGFLFVERFTGVLDPGVGLEPAGKGAYPDKQFAGQAHPGQEILQHERAGEAVRGVEGIVPVRMLDEKGGAPGLRGGICWSRTPARQALDKP